MKSYFTALILSLTAAMILLGVVFFRDLPIAAANSAFSEEKALVITLQEEKPVDGWIVCKDLGVGPVPGISGNRQRVRLCHREGWAVKTYCLRPELPVPQVGATCRRTGPDTYWCGNGLQPLKEYQVQVTPTPTVTPTSLPTATPTMTPPQITEFPYPTQTPTPRPKPGGLGYQQILSYALSFFNPKPVLQVDQLATPTPFRPLHPTAILYPVEPVVASIPVQPVTMKIPGLDLQIGSSPVSMRIKPGTKRVNSGKPLKISFKIAGECEFGEGAACLNTYLDPSGAEISLLTVHSGLGGEAQSLRNALEGTGFDTAGLQLSDVKDNLQRLAGSTVHITQGSQGEADLRIIAAVRLPAKQVREYVELPASEILAFAARQNPELLDYVHPNEPLIILETCGWRMPGETVPANLPDTSASIYILVLGQAK